MQVYFTRLIKKPVLCFLFLLTSYVCSAQDSSVHFTFTTARVTPTCIEVQIHAKVPAGVKLYSIKDTQDAMSAITFDPVIAKHRSGPLTESGALQQDVDSLLKRTASFYTDSVRWTQVFAVNAADSLAIKGSISYLCKVGELYVFNDTSFVVYSMPGPANKEASNQPSLLLLFVSAFLGGLLALLTPCVYSMIPITVGFFTKRSASRRAGLRNALLYAFSIITIFTLLGFLVTLIFGPAALNNLATNWVANLVFFALFVLFGFSFLGAFEIQLPSSWMNGVNNKAGLSSVGGIFFMAFTLVLVSFSCTGPIIGNLLVVAARGSYFGPLVGMFGFSLALALPFALFAFFPSKLNVLGKAGGWLNAVKVTLGFIELMLALKFLSNADLAKGWRLLDREIFLAAWIVLAVALSLYLFGFIRFKHDDRLPANDFGLPHLSVTRLSLAIVAGMFAAYLLPGLAGAPLKGVSAFLPPMGTQDFTGGVGVSAEMKPAVSQDAPVKYVDRMKLYEPEVARKYGLVTYFDYKEALEAARKAKKPLMLDFTGINCVNCRKMEAQVWSDPKVLALLKEHFIIASLYVDAQQVDLPIGEQYFSKALNKQVMTLGDRNADVQVSKFGANTQPYYFFLDGEENKLATEGYGYDPDVAKFVAHLEEVIKKGKQ